MKLVLQIAAGILLAIVVAVGSVGAYKYISAEWQAGRESAAFSAIWKLTPADVVSRCGTPLYQKSERMPAASGMPDQEWQTLSYLSPEGGVINMVIAPDHMVKFTARRGVWIPTRNGCKCCRV